jgi:hypothetical protein
VGLRSSSANTDPEPTGGDLALTSRRGGALAGMTAAGAWVLRLLILVVSHAGGTVDFKMFYLFSPVSALP